MSLFLYRLPLARLLLRLEDLGTGHSFGERITKLGSQIISVCCPQDVPHVGLDIVLRHAMSEFIEPSEIALRTRVPPCSGFRIPVPCLNIVLRHTLAIFI